MGLFDRAKDSRIQQIISKQLGSNFSIAASGSGSFYCLGLNLNIKPFYAAIGEQGIAFINKAEVVIVLEWSEIHRCVKKSGETDLEITFSAPIEDTVNIYSKEPPFRYRHDATIYFNDPKTTSFFFEYFQKNKLNVGFSLESIDLFENWIKWGINEPITLEKFHEANKDWATKEIRNTSYEVWGDFLDSERFMYFIGRGVCEGKIPSDLLKNAFSEYQRMNIENSKFTLKSKLPDEKSLKIIDETMGLSLYEKDQPKEEWFLVRVGVQYQEWVGNMPTKERRAAAKIYNGENDWTFLELHNDFHPGTTFPTLNWNPKNNPNKIEFGGNFVTFQDEDLPRLTKTLGRK